MYTYVNIVYSVNKELKIKILLKGIQRRFLSKRIKNTF